MAHGVAVFLGGARERRAGARERGGGAPCLQHAAGRKLNRPRPDGGARHVPAAVEYASTCARSILYDTSADPCASAAGSHLLRVRVHGCGRRRLHLRDQAEHLCRARWHWPPLCYLLLAFFSLLCSVLRWGGVDAGSNGDDSSVLCAVYCVLRAVRCALVRFALWLVRLCACALCAVCCSWCVVEPFLEVFGTPVAWIPKIPHTKHTAKVDS